MSLERISDLYYTATQARQKLGMTKDAFNHYVRTNVIKKTTLIGNHGYYEKRMIDTMALSIAATMLTAQSSDLRFEKATLETQGDEFKLAMLNFGERTQQFNEKRIELLKKNPDMSYYLYDGKFMVASINSVPLQHEGILKFKNGERGWLLGEYVEQYVAGKPLELIIIDCMTTPLAPNNKRKQYAQRLFAELADLLASWASRGIEIASIYACGGTPDGRQILESAKFTYLGEPRANRHIYELDIVTSGMKLLKPYKDAYNTWKRVHGVEEE